MWLDIAPSILKGSLNYSAALTWQKNPLRARRLQRERWELAEQASECSGGLLPALPVISNNKIVHQYLHSVCGVTYYYYQQFSFMRATLLPAKKEQSRRRQRLFLVWVKCMRPTSFDI
jgi:hypothetical protein